MKNESIDYDESSEIKSLLEEKFGEFIDEENVPEGIKDDVFNSLNTIALIGDLADLFTIKFAKTNFSFIDPNAEKLSDESLD